MMSAVSMTPSWARRLRQRLWRVDAADRGPIVLRHRRIYILPTRRGLALIATLTIMLLTSMNYALSLGHALTFLVAGLVAAALLQTYRNLAGIAASPLAAGEAFAGGEIAFTLALANAGAARQAIVVTPRSGRSVSVDLPTAASRGRRSRAAQAGIPNSSRVPAAAARWSSVGPNCLRDSTPKRGSRVSPRGSSPPSAKHVLSASRFPASTCRRHRERDIGAQRFPHSHCFPRSERRDLRRLARDAAQPFATRLARHAGSPRSSAAVGALAAVDRRRRIGFGCRKNRAAGRSPAPDAAASLALALARARGGLGHPLGLRLPPRARSLCRIPLCSGWHQIRRSEKRA